jgi:FkbM family methyltransferase
MNLKETVYKLWNIATLGKGTEKHISGFSLRLPVRYSKYFPQDYERDNFKFLEEHCVKGSVVVDIGAHIGLFAVRAAQLTGEIGKVYAFEPTPKTNALLQKTIQINGMEEIIEARHEAIAEKDGLTYFNISDTEGDNSNSLVEYRLDKHLNKVEVKIVSLDNFVSSKSLKKLDFIKIDAEGYEYNVLEGAIETFNTLRPKGILALHPEGIKSNGNSLNDIYDTLERVNYEIIYEKRQFSREEFCKKNELFDVHLIPKQG